MQFSATLLSALALLFGNLPSCQSFQSTFAPARLPLKESSALRPRTTGLEKNKYYHVATANLPRRLMSSTELHVSPLTALASSPLGAVSVLAGIVCFHEAGHYLAARSFNITVEEFSVGFGPKLLGFQAVGNAFNLRALPLGGYVRFPENYDMVKAEEMQEEARQAFLKRREEEGWTGWQEFLNTLTFGQWDERRRQQGKAEQAQQAVEEAAKRSWWQKAIQPKSTTTITNDPEDFEIDYYDDPNLLQNRPWFERAVVLSGGVVFNMILAFSLYFGEINLGSGIPKPIFDSGVVVSQAPRPDGAAMGLLRQGDIITRINGT
jgi:membrane-associated protease RseP (regulator of RpoE activity)